MAFLPVLPEQINETAWIRPTRGTNSPSWTQRAAVSPLVNPTQIFQSFALSASPHTYTMLKFNMTHRFTVEGQQTQRPPQWKRRGHKGQAEVGGSSEARGVWRAMDRTHVHAAKTHTVPLLTLPFIAITVQSVGSGSLCPDIQRGSLLQFRLKGRTSLSSVVVTIVVRWSLRRCSRHIIWHGGIWTTSS